MMSICTLSTLALIQLPYLRSKRDIKEAQVPFRGMITA
jgi:hypothetical protein